MTSRRRLVLSMAALVVVPRAVCAQKAGRQLRIATLEDGAPEARDAAWQTFLGRMRALGYDERSQFVLQRHHGSETADQLRERAREIVASKPDIIIAPTTGTARIAMQATSAIPIIFVGTADPVGSGLVASLARPGGNVTGLSNSSGELGAKWLELVLELAPGMRRIAFLTDTRNPGSILVFRRTEKAAAARGVSLRMLAAVPRAELEKSFQAMAAERTEGFIVSFTSTVLVHRDEIVRFAASRRIPAVYGRREYVDAGGLASYGADVTLLYTRLADFVHRIADGAKPANLPVEQPNILRLVLNRKTAADLGLTIPPATFLRADAVID